MIARDFVVNSPVHDRTYQLCADRETWWIELSGRRLTASEEENLLPWLAKAVAREAFQQAAGLEVEECIK